jgi:hypothetical protein
MTSMGNSMETAMELFADKLSDSMQRIPRSEAFEVTARALEAIEEDEGFSDNDLKDAALVIGNDPMVAHMYLHYKSQTARRNYLLHHMEERRK